MDKNNCNDTIRDAFGNWRKALEGHDFANLSQLKKVFNSVDYIGNDRYVFNILGNNYRFGIRSKAVSKAWEELV